MSRRFSAPLLRQLRMIACVAVPVLLMALYGARCYRQARLIEDIWELAESNSVTFVHGQRLRSARADRLGARYWSWVTAADVSTGSAKLWGLKSLEIKRSGSQLSKLSGLSNLKDLELLVTGNADFTPLLALTQLKSVRINWKLAEGGPLTEAQTDALCTIPLDFLRIDPPDGVLTTPALKRLRQSHPGLEIIPDGVADYPQEAETVTFLRSQNLFVHANKDGKVIHVDMHHIGHWTEGEWQRVADLSELETLHVRGSTIESDGIAHLRECRKLLTCRFIHCKFSQESWNGLAQLRQVRELLLSDFALPAIPADAPGFDALEDLTLQQPVL